MVETKSLFPRYIETPLNSALTDTPVVCLLGPRQVGKTTLAQCLTPQRAYVNFDEQSLLNAALNDPVGFVAALPDSVILDEMQRVPELMPAIKTAVDKHRQPGRFLLTGSANLLLLPKVSESLAGRVEVIYLHPLSECEKHHTQARLLSELLEGRLKPEIASAQEPISGLPQAVVSGGYPEPNKRSPARARQWQRQYLNAIIQRDVKDIAAIRDETELLRLVELVACRTATLLNISSLANELDIQRETAEKYLSILERLFLVRRLPAWHRNHAKRLIKAPKIHMIDSGLASTLNRLTVEDWRNQSTAFGALLESFVVQQLICQAGWLESDLHFSHYRDKDQVEVDLVIEQGRDVWAVEVKRAASIQAKDGAGLKRIAAQAGKNFRGGMLLYTGSNCLPLSEKNIFAVPIDRLWK